MTQSCEMDPELAKKLFEVGSTCVFLGVSKGSEFGIDLKSWTTGEKFLGIKMIPPGFHYVHYRMANHHGDMSPTVGFIWTTDRSQIMVKKWMEKLGAFQDETEDTKCKIKSDLVNLDTSLGAYPFEVWDKWKSLTNNISDNVAKHILPETGQISSVLELKGASDEERKDEKNSSKRRKRHSAPFSDIETYGDLLPELHAATGTELRFSKVPDLCYPEGSTPSEITKHSLDSSYLLEQIMSQHERSIDLLGELQFAFVAFLVGHSMEGFEHWKRLLGILCSVQERLPKYITIFSELLTILQPQLEEIPEDFLVDIVASSNFVYQSLRKLFRNIAVDSGDARLRTKCQRLAATLTEKFSWDFEDLEEEDDDDLPVIVAT